jgi:predicted phage replisome organizer
MADVKWIKITTDIFDDEKVLLIESLPEADSIIVIWFKLLCLAGKQNNSGVFVMGNSMPYTDQMLATIFRRKESTVQLALQTFQQFGMVEIIDGVITIPNWEKHQNLDQMEKLKEANRKRVAKHREKQKALSGNVTGNVTVTECNAIDKIRLEEDKIEIREEENIKKIRHKFGEYKNVLLSDEDVEKLKTEFPTDWVARIENLSSYIASTGKKYKNHLATIRNWARNEKQQEKPKTSTLPFDESKYTL